MKHVRRLAIVPSQALTTSTLTRKEEAVSSLAYFIPAFPSGCIYTHPLHRPHTVNSNERLLFRLNSIPVPGHNAFSCLCLWCTGTKGKIRRCSYKTSKKSGSRYGFYTNNRTLSISTNSVQPLRSLNLPLRGPGTTLLAFKFKFFLSLFERVFIYNEISSPSGSLEIAFD